MYQFKAYFYKLDNAQKSDCRLYLDIRSENVSLTRPDLILIMLNPGSCKSKHMEYEKEIDVNPDQTLHRIKSLMEKQNERNLNWIRVLNLSDLVNAKSREFFKIVSEVEETTTRHHSIFDDSRLEDLKKFIAPNDKVFFACGVNGNSNDWVENSKCKINRIGAIVLNKTNKYYHPLVRPNKKDIVDWRDQIREVLKST